MQDNIKIYSNDISPPNKKGLNSETNKIYYMRYFITILILLFSNNIFGQKKDKIQIIKSKSYFNNYFQTYDLQYKSITTDTLEISKIWIGNKRYYYNKERLKIWDMNFDFGIEVVIYKKEKSGNDKFDKHFQKTIKANLPPFKYKGEALICYYINNKKYYYILDKFSKKCWLCDYHSESAPELDPEMPPYMFEYKQQ